MLFVVVDFFFFVIAVVFGMTYKLSTHSGVQCSAYVMINCYIFTLMYAACKLSNFLKGDWMWLSTNGQFNVLNGSYGFHRRRAISSDSSPKRVPWLTRMKSFNLWVHMEATGSLTRSHPGGPIDVAVADDLFR